MKYLNKGGNLCKKKNIGEENIMLSLQTGNVNIFPVTPPMIRTILTVCFVIAHCMCWGKIVVEISVIRKKGARIAPTA
jgi:hypothetical protein